MKSRYNILAPLLMAFFLCCCLWVVTDVAYGVRAWEADLNSWVKRLEALTVMTISVFLSYFFFRFIATYFFEKNSKNSRFLRFQEYGIVFAFILITSNIALYTVVAYINRSSYRWGECFMMNATSFPLLLLFYVSIRNNILFAKYTEKMIQLEKIKVDQLESELKLLKAQYHPHFLFNALNTIYFQIDEENVEAIETMDLLSGLLRYQLYDINKEVPVRQEMEYLQNYMQFQKLRMTERLQFTCYIDPALKEQPIHPLLFQPLLENAFKYVGGEYRLHVEIRAEGNKIHFSAINSVGPADISRNKAKGIGIENLKRRLELLYPGPGKHQLQTKLDNNWFTVNLTIEFSE